MLKSVLDGKSGERLVLPVEPIPAGVREECREEISESEAMEGGECENACDSCDFGLNLMELQLLRRGVILKDSENFELGTRSSPSSVSLMLSSVASLFAVCSASQTAVRTFGILSCRQLSKTCIQ